MRHYTFADQLYLSDVKNYRIAANETSQVLELHPASKTLYLRNDGADDVFIAFDKDEATTDDFKLTAADGLVEMRVQCEKIAMVCAATETANIRISSNY